MSHTDDDSDIPEGATIDDVDALDLFLDRLLAGADPAADAPAWSRDVAQLVRAAQAPAQPGELAGEDDIVGRMVEVRRLAADRAAPVLARTGTGGHAATDAGRSPTGESTAAETGVLASVTHLVDRRGRDRSDRLYRAKHAAARLEASRHPALRTVGRVLAMKAAAVTTAAVVGVAAAAAATTGIVATVVVPAFTDEPPEPQPVPTTEGRRRTTTTDGTRSPAPADTQDPATCAPGPECPAPPFATATPSTTTSTTRPSPTTTEAARGDDPAPSTTTTVATSTTSTTVGTQTTVESTTTTTAPPGPGPDPAASTFIDDGSGDTGGGSTP